MALAKAQLDLTGYVYETDPQGNLNAIVFTGTIFDGEPDADGNLLDEDDNVIHVNWTWRGAFRLAGDALAALPAPDPLTDNTPDDLRYQAIMQWLGMQVKAQHTSYAAAVAALPTITPRPAAEVAALPVFTAALLAQLP